MSKLHAKLFYLEQLRTSPNHHKALANRMSLRFNVSPAMIKDELLEGGYIKLVALAPMGETNKKHYFYALTNKKFAHTNEPEKPVVVERFWPCGTKKSTGNAFDLSMARGLFNKSELAASTNKGKPNNYNSTMQIIAYSRA